jgi:hypothetical protein
MAEGISSPAVYLHSGFGEIDMDKIDLPFLAIPIMLLFLFEMLSLKRDMIYTISRQRLLPRYMIYAIVIVVILIFSPKGMAGEFIYFQF